MTSDVHDRMPVSLPRERLGAWLEPASRYSDLLEPDADALELVPVSTHVDSAKNDGPEYAEPITA